MEEAPENGKESSNSAHANGINECILVQILLGNKKYKESNLMMVKILSQIPE
jgi:hypothetical protein